MDKDQQDLIRQIMENVKDEKLRDDLLRKIAGSGTAPSSAILDELEKLGLNKKGVKELATFQIASQIVTGYIVGGLFTIGGAAATVWQLTNHYNEAGMFGPWFPALFCAAGVYSLVWNYKYSRAFKK